MYCATNKRMACFFASWKRISYLCHRQILTYIGNCILIFKENIWPTAETPLSVREPLWNHIFDGVSMWSCGIAPAFTNAGKISLSMVWKPGFLVTVNVMGFCRKAQMNSSIWSYTQWKWPPRKAGFFSDLWPNVRNEITHYVMLCLTWKSQKQHQTLFGIYS